MQFCDPVRWLHQLRTTCYACVRCGWLEWHGVDLFCQSCKSRWRELEEPEAHAHSWQNGFLSRWLYTWTPLTDSYVGNAVHALKGARRSHAWRAIAERWAARELEIGLGPRIFVPAPSSRGQPDHAYAFATALADTWGTRLIDCLQSEDPAALPQKQLRAEDRQRRHFRVKFLPNVAPSEVLTFVDDVFTTGATSRAAYVALGEPIRFEAWALASRPKLAEYGRF